MARARVKFTRNGERWELADKLAIEQAERDYAALIAREEKARIDALPYGGNFFEQYSCYNCKFRSNSHGDDRCLNPAVMMTEPTLIDVANREGEQIGPRSEYGICGPDGLFYAKKEEPRKDSKVGKVLGILFIICAILAILGAIGYFVGWDNLVCGIVVLGFIGYIIAD